MCKKEEPKATAEEPREPETSAETHESSEVVEGMHETSKNDEAGNSIPAKEDDDAPQPTLVERLWSFYVSNEFLILVVIAILLARAYPPLGADYLQPKITATWIAVVFIFGE